MGNRGRGSWRGVYRCLLGAGLLLFGDGLSAAAELDRAAQVDYWLSRSAVEAEVAEAALMAQLDQARAALPAQDDRVWLEKLRDYQPKALVPGEHGSEDLDAAFPIANAARGLINRLDRDLVMQQALALADRPEAYLDALATASLQPRGFHDALPRLSQPQRMALREAAAARVQERSIANLAGELAMLDQPDSGLLRAALAKADAVDALHWLRQAQARFGESEALAIYGAAQFRSELRSAAQLLTAQQAELSEEQLAQWLAQLSDPRAGGSAAAALAKRMDSQLAGIVAAKARTSVDSLERKRLLLALKLSALKQGGAITSLRNDPQFLAKLDKETRAWLLD